MRIVITALIAFTTSILFSLSAPAAEWYVSPEGEAGNAGTEEAPLDLASVLAGQAAVEPGDTVWLMEGRYPAPEENGERRPFVSSLRGEEYNPIIIRAIPGERATLDGWLHINGAHTWFWGLEIADYVQGEQRGNYIIRGPGTKLINLHLHSSVMGIDCWESAVNSEIYGCIIHNFGMRGTDRGHGHAIYTQNREGTKRIVDNIAFDGFGWNLHGYSEEGSLRGYRIEGNIFFSPGMKQDDPPKDNILMAAYTPQDRISVVNNVAYHPETGGWRPNVRMSTYRDKNISGECRDNYFMGLSGVIIAQWEKMVFTGNTIWATGRILDPRFGAGDDWTVDNNTYITRKDNSAFRGGMTFDEYRETTGFDGNSTLIDADRPAENFVFIRPNQYEPGRGHVAIFNWEGLDAVDIDLSDILEEGAQFTIHNVQQDIYGEPVAEGVFNGDPVSVPMLKSALAPDFDAFLVRTAGK